MMRRKRPTPPQTKISVSGTPAGVQQALEAFTEFSRSRSLSSDAQWRFLVAIDEVLTNIISHGRPDAAIGLRFSLTKEAVTVDIMDSSEAFNPLLAAAPALTAPIEERRPGGLGVAIVRGLMDRVVYERRADKNRLTLMWRVSPHAR